jgi:hypothetical protein
MASSRSTNTMAEFLSRILGDIGQAKTLPDADLEFLVGLETQIIGKIREPYDVMQGAGQPPPLGGMPGGAMMPPGAPPAPPAMPPMPMGQPGGAPAGLRTQPNMPNMDEMSRVLSTPA